MTAPRFMSPHAVRQCVSREIPVDVLRGVLLAKMSHLREPGDYAVHVGRSIDRGGLIGSNGTEVWAIVRDDTVTTVMLRRKDQPSTARAFDVDGVIA